MSHAFGPGAEGERLTFHWEEAYWFGEGVLPELHRRGRWARDVASLS